MRYLPEVIAACLVGVLFTPTATADEKDRYKEAFRRQREDRKRYEEHLREDQKRYEKRAREERKRYEERFREDAKRQREFERESRKRGGWSWGGFGGYPGGQPGYQFPGQGYPYAQPTTPFRWGPATYPQMLPASPFPPSGFGPMPSVGRPYSFSGQIPAAPLAPQPILPSFPHLYPNR